MSNLNISKDHKLITVATIIAVFITLVAINVKAVTADAEIWQFAIIVVGGLVISALVNMYILTERIASIKKSKTTI